MNLRQIEAFRAVMTEGSVTQAAVALGVTQPAVSCLIANLEESMGFLLFKRHRGRFQPTGEAEIFLEDAERLLASHSRATRTARDIRDLKSGSLRVAALPAVSMNFMPKLIAGFIRDRPQIKVSLQTRSSVQIREWISAQLFDIGFAELPADDPAMDIDPLSFDCVCALPAGHPLASKLRLDPHDLKGEPLIVLNPEHSTHYHLKAAFEAAGVPWAPHAECYLFQPSCRMAAEGVGIAVVDPFAAHDFEGQGVVFRPFVPRIPYELGLIYPALRPRSRLTAEFATALKAALKEMLQDKHQPGAP
ncbi:MAG: LysR family transcriptional regulator [Rhodospirillaceae bacterium]|nr:LysR family transcriptional regulator [Rhodospirillaceae bacterium]